MTQILHVSDLHVPVSLSTVPIKAFFGKRAPAVVWGRMFRSAHFRDARRKVEAYVRFAREAQVQGVLCTGDYVQLGTEPELRVARTIIDDLTRFPLGFVTLPGNHDVYLHDTVLEGWFERYFGEFCRSDFAECSPAGWPTVRLWGPHAAIVAVRSARPNPAPWRSSGSIPNADLRGLEALLKHPSLSKRWFLIALHYGLRRSDGSPDRPLHGLENAGELIAVLRPYLGRVVLVHGHIHHCYHHARTQSEPPMFCAGGSTYAGREGAWVYGLGARELEARRVTWDGHAFSLTSDDPVRVPMSHI